MALPASDTNRAISDRSPAEYVPYLEQRADIDQATMDTLIASHAITPEYLRRADFKSFFEDRSDQLLSLIGEAMGKAPVRKRDLLAALPSTAR